MSDFNILRVNECNRMIYNAVRGPKKWFFFWACAVLMLFLNLGTGSIISGVESQWLVMAQEIIRSGDWFQPTVNGEVASGSPMICSWFIALISLFAGEINLFTARMPSALAALLLLGCTTGIARNLFGEKTAFLSGWILMTFYPFCMLGRTAGPEMENMAFTAAAVAWYVYCRNRRTLLDYFLFWAICSVGAQTGGFSVLIVPPCLVFMDLLLNSKLRSLLEWRFVAGTFLGILVYGLPFVLRIITAWNAGTDLSLFLEQILSAVRTAVNRDHTWGIYLKNVWQSSLPWMVVFCICAAGGVCRMFLHWKAVPPDEKWIFFSVLFLWILFPACGFGEGNILPAVPFMAVYCGYFLVNIPERPEKEKCT